MKTIKYPSLANIIFMSLLLEIIKIFIVSLNLSSIVIISRNCLCSWVWRYHYRSLNNLLIIWWNSSGSLPSIRLWLFYEKEYKEKPVSLPGSLSILKLVFKRDPWLLWVYRFHQVIISQPSELMEIQETSKFREYKTSHKNILEEVSSKLSR